jgi:hypothetical protein
MTKAKIGTFEDLLSVSAPEVRPLVAAARRLVLEVDPNATEVVRLGDRAATWGVGPKKMTEGHVYVMPHASHVNLGFYRGATLDDPDGLLEGTGAKMRHVKLRTLDDLERCRSLVAAAVEERRRALRG